MSISTLPRAIGRYTPHLNNFFKRGFSRKQHVIQSCFDKNTPWWAWIPFVEDGFIPHGLTARAAVFTRIDPCPKTVSRTQVSKETKELIASWFSRYPDLRCLVSQKNGEKVSDYVNEPVGQVVIPLLRFHYLVQGDYKGFSYKQKKHSITEETFWSLHATLRSIFDSNYMKLAPSQIEELMRVMIIFQYYSQKIGQSNEDYQRFLKNIKNFSCLFSEFRQLDPVAQNYLSTIASSFPDYLAMFFLIGGEKTFHELYNRHIVSNGLLDFAIGFFPVLFLTPVEKDVQGYNIVGCSPRHIHSFKILFSLCVTLKKPMPLGASRVYQCYFSYIASCVGLNPESEEEEQQILVQILVVLAAILGLSTRYEGGVIKKSLDFLSREQISRIVDGLGGNTAFGFSCSNLRQFLQQLVLHPALGQTDKERLETIILQVLPFVAQVFLQLKKQTTDPIVLKLPDANEIVKDWSLLTRPFTITIIEGRGFITYIRKDPNHFFLRYLEQLVRKIF